jgi:hypothetical protein
MLGATMMIVAKANNAKAHDTAAEVVARRLFSRRPLEFMHNERCMKIICIMEHSIFDVGFGNAFSL